MAHGTIAFDTLTTSDQVNTSTEKSIDTSYIFNGVSKAWLQMNGSGTAVVNDSFNITSMSDEGTGRYDTTFTYNMNNVNYSSTGAAGELNDSGGNRSLGLRARATTGQNIVGFYDGNSVADLVDLNLSVFGDLA